MIRNNLEGLEGLEGFFPNLAYARNMSRTLCKFPSNYSNPSKNNLLLSLYTFCYNKLSTVSMLRLRRLGAVYRRHDDDLKRT